MIDTISPKFLRKAAECPNGPEEAILEDLVFNAYNGADDSTMLKPVLKALWFAFVAREDFMHGPR